MRISQIYVYPIKSLRPTPVREAVLTRHGFPHDRRYMLAKVLDEDSSLPLSQRLKNMHVAYFPEMTLFLTDIRHADSGDANGSQIEVTHAPPEGGEQATLSIPLQPSTAGLETVEVTMHNSAATAFVMQKRYNEWFSSRFGYDVVLLYLGDRHREVLMTIPPNVNLPRSWFSTLTGDVMGSGNGAKEFLTFADCAPYLVISDTSLRDVSARFSDGMEVDVTKFRPNVVVEGAEEAWEEDFWREIRLGDAKVAAAQNCVRCVSLNIDYETGKPGKGEVGDVLKKMMKDRRVDKGAKYSPVFGRYCFLEPECDGVKITVGEEVKVLAKNEERTFFDWKSLQN